MEEVAGAAVVLVWAGAPVEEERAVANWDVVDGDQVLREIGLDAG